MEKKTKIILIVLIVLIACGVAISLFASPYSVNSSGNQTITDMANRTVTIPSEVNRVVATSPPMTTIMYMLAPEKLAGVNFQWTDEELKYVPDQYKDKFPVVGGWFGSQDGNYEEFIASEPDLVVEGIDEGMGVDLSTVEERQEKFASLPVVSVTDNTNVTKIDNTIEFLAKLLGAEDKANQLIGFNDKYLSEVQTIANSIPDSEKKSVYYASGEDGLSTYASGSSHGQLISLVGGKNVADTEIQNTGGELTVSIEQIISWNPDIIIATDEDFYKNVYNDSKWASLKAVKNHQVYISPQSPFKWFDRPPGANIIIGVPWTAKVIYPDKYSNINMVDATKEFYTNFYHYDLSDEEAKDILTSSGIDESDL
ncbi:ABC transporter substrate-binding protein [Methanobrevibacter olleyae]|uniref:Iron ABC transporter substrate-binding protein n=1 Tax=Methanobrevibacter olleyae TaxID=294671 RepID=A0A126QY42_METOL|nr:ABC transporter substrate-binding protein [Methanobrevibacter olleyae]AMK14579.1 iron ABC transporter substrate-binding protein [Methanobrevibacter olleyae]SFL27737.1 iron complex transport system substrate-binding protein [Methanobrevibacter olleyae]